MTKADKTPAYTIASSTSGRRYYLNVCGSVTNLIDATGELISSRLQNEDVTNTSINICYTEDHKEFIAAGLYPDAAQGDVGLDLKLMYHTDQTGFHYYQVVLQCDRNQSSPFPVYFNDTNKDVITIYMNTSETCADIQILPMPIPAYQHTSRSYPFYVVWLIFIGIFGMIILAAFRIYMNKRRQLLQQRNGYIRAEAIEMSNIDRPVGSFESLQASQQLPQQAPQQLPQQSQQYYYVPQYLLNNQFVPNSSTLPSPVPNTANTAYVVPQVFNTFNQTSNDEELARKLQATYDQE